MSATLSAVSAPAPAAAPRIGTALLLPQDRIPRAPLSAWTAMLRARAAAARRGCRAAGALSAEAGTLGNNAALIAAQRGERTAVVELCERQLWWQHRLSRRSRRPEIAARCVQPWVNLARLESAAGAWEAAVSRLERLGARGRAEGIALQPLRGDGTGCQHIPRGGDDFLEMLESVHVIDTLRVLLQNRRHAELFAFSARVKREFRPGLALWALEASVVAACVDGDFDLARRAGREALLRDDARGLPGALFRLRLAEVAACAGQPERARGVLGPLARAASQGSRHPGVNLQPLYVLARLAGACLEAGLPDDAHGVARVVYEGGRVAGDEVFQLEALRTLAAAAPEPERAGWTEKLWALEQATEYRQYRAPGAPPPDRTAFGALCAELAELYAS
ncbi:MAG TPA: hypothetical protein VEQ60_05610 [Longimicrobium sp.]|nr:hypothetical protein [Longimicrobium sp.]